MKNKHLTNRQLQAYFEKKEKHGFSGILNHTLECTNCHRHLSAYKVTDEILAEMIPAFTSIVSLDRIIKGVKQRVQKYEQKMIFLQTGSGILVLIAGGIYAQYKYGIWGSMLKTLRSIWDGFISARLIHIDIPVVIVIAILIILVFFERRINSRLWKSLF